MVYLGLLMVSVVVAVFLFTALDRPDDDVKVRALAAVKEKPSTAREVAKAIGVPYHHAIIVLHQLRHDGVLVSVEEYDPDVIARRGGLPSTIYFVGGDGGSDAV